jgi:phage shock protein E
MKLSAFRICMVPALLMATILAGAAETSNTPIAPADLAALIEAGDAPIILDVRTEDEFSDGHIPGAINIPHTELSDRIMELDGYQDKEIILHCRSGKRAGIVEPVLIKDGFIHVRDLDGQWLQWQAGGYPIETGP